MNPHQRCKYSGSPFGRSIFLQTQACTIVSASQSSSGGGLRRLRSQKGGSQHRTGVAAFCPWQLAYLYCRVQKWIEGGASRGGDTKSKLYLRKTLFFVIQKCVEDVGQDETSVAYLAESMMKPPGLAKTEFRRILMKPREFSQIQMTQIG